MSLWISEHNASLASWINSDGIWSVPGDLYPFNSAVAIQTQKDQVQLKMAQQPQISINIHLRKIKRVTDRQWTSL
jgi:hypothetical protein